MSKINIADVQALIAFAIVNNKSGLIDAMNSSGYPVAQNISDADLFDAVGKVGDNNGIPKLKVVLSKVAIDKSKLTQEQAKNLAIKYNDVLSNPNAKTFGDWIKGLGDGIGNLISGHTVVNQNPNITTQTSVPLLSSFEILATAIIGIIAIVFINRGGESNKGKTTISWIIGIIILGVVLTGIFAKKQTITQSGGGGSQTVLNGALGWLNGILNGLHLSIAG